MNPIDFVPFAFLLLAAALLWRREDFLSGTLLLVIPYLFCGRGDVYPLIHCSA